MRCEQCRMDWQRWLQGFDLDIASAHQKIYLQESFQVLTAVREGYGIGLADRIEVHSDLSSGNLITLSDQFVSAEYDHFLVSHEENRLSVREQLFVSHIESSIEEMGE